MKSSPPNPAHVTLNPNTGCFIIHLQGFKPIICRSQIVTGGCSRRETPLKWKKVPGSVSTLACTNPDGEWTLSFATDSTPNSAGIRLHLEGRARRALKKLSLFPLCVGRIPAEHSLEHGRAMGGCRLTLTSRLKERRAFRSSFQHLVTQGGVTLQFSHPLMQKNLSWMTGEADRNGIRNLAIKTDLGDVTAKAKVAAETLQVRVSENGHSLMTSWADANIEIPREQAPIRNGWNSWDYYRWTITEEEVLRNAEFIASDPVLSRHIRRVIVDDGWQYCYGEWSANPLFPSGMEKLAATLGGMGFEPGLWFAPTIIEPHARLAQEESHLLARGESGLPCLAFSCMERRGFVLDPTQSAARARLHDLFRRYADMGWRYFKLDFLGQTLNARRFADPSVPRGQIIRKILEPIREATRGRAEILGCNYPFETGNACVDAVRTSSDIHAKWSSVCENVHSIAARFWSHGRLWINDPDFALCRGRDTSDDPNLFRIKPCLVFVSPEQHTASPAHHDSLVNNRENEARVLLSLCLISGGIINLSDNLPRLNRKGLEMARQVVSAEHGEAGVALDMFCSEKPSLWFQKLANRRARALLVNWGERPKKLRLDLQTCGAGTLSHAVDFWTGAPVVLRNQMLESSLPPHSCLLVEME